MESSYVKCTSYVKYTKKDLFWILNVKTKAVTCGCTIKCTNTPCEVVPYYHVPDVDRWVCGRHLKQVVNKKATECRDDTECSICMSDIQSNELLRLSCKHAFHTKCIQTWEGYSTRCPLCRSRFNTNLKRNLLMEFERVYLEEMRRTPGSLIYGM